MLSVYDRLNVPFCWIPALVSFSVFMHYNLTKDIYSLS
jgi:hypothetical protein